jgi:hypothetical protein
MRDHERFVTVLIEETRYIEGCLPASEFEDMTPAGIVETLRAQGERPEHGGYKVIWMKTEAEEP